MRQPALIAIVAIAAIAVAWLWLVRTPDASIAARVATAPVATTHAQAAPTPPPAQSDSEAAAVRAQTAIPPPEPGPAATKTAPAPAVVAPQKPAEPAATDATPDEGSDAAADDESSDEPESADDTDDATSFDAHRAADLMADWMAKQDLAASEQSAAPVPSSKDLKAFDQEEADAEWAAAAQQQIEATLNQWLDTLPDDIAGNLDVIHVECRQTLCQVLTAESSIVPEGHAPYEQQWTQGIDTLSHQPWYTELGFSDLTTAVNHDSESGYFLYQVYLRREAKAPTG